MTAVVYVRVSTEEQAVRGFSLQEQLAECRRCAEGLGAAEIIEVIDDTGGDFLERPGLEHARALVRTGEVRWFVCLDPDRFSRNLLNQLLVTNEIDQYGTELVFVQHHREKTAEGNLFYAIRGAIAEFEKAKILERTRRGKRGKARQGRLPNYCDPYGYSMDQQSDLLCVEEREARWVREMFAWAAHPNLSERIGPSQIAARLNQLGIPAPRGSYWYRSTVSGILRNPLYTGTLYWGRMDHSGVYQTRRVKGQRRVRPRPRPVEEWIALPVPALITPKQFDTVQQCLASGSTRRPPRCASILTGVLRCGRCGGRLYAKRSSYRYLVCANRYSRVVNSGTDCRDSACTLPHIRAEPVERHVWSRLTLWLTAPATLERLLPALGRSTQDDGSQEERELAAINLQLEEARRAKKRLVALVVQAALDPAVAGDSFRQLEQQTVALTQRKTSLEQSLAFRHSSTAHTNDLADCLITTLNQLTEPERRSVVRRLVRTVRLTGPNPAEWEIEPADTVS
jgi:site-specific DNA recombinase